MRPIAQLLLIAPGRADCRLVGEAVFDAITDAIIANRAGKVFTFESRRGEKMFERYGFKF